MCDMYGVQKQVLVLSAALLLPEWLGRRQEPHALEHLVEGEEALAVRGLRNDTRNKLSLPARRRPGGGGGVCQHTQK